MQGNIWELVANIVNTCKKHNEHFFIFETNTHAWKGMHLFVNISINTIAMED